MGQSVSEERKPEPRKTSSSAREVTLIFVDVDGVLNVGVRDPGHSPVSFNEANVQLAQKLLSLNPEDSCAKRLVSVYRHELGPGEQKATFAKLLAAPDVDVSNVLASRLAQLIRAAGGQRLVVLASNWRRPQHAGRVRRLEEVVSKFLGEPFAFDDRTPLREESTPEGRLTLIGDYLRDYCQKSTASRVRALVLEDFYISPISAWNCGGSTVDSVQSAELYLQTRATTSCCEVAVHLMHTYDQWHLPGGLLCQVGIGIGLQHLCKALTFLGSSCPLCSSGRQEKEPNSAASPTLNHIKPVRRPGCTVEKIAQPMDVESPILPAELVHSPGSTNSTMASPLSDGPDAHPGAQGIARTGRSALGGFGSISTSSSSRSPCNSSHEVSFCRGASLSDVGRPQADPSSGGDEANGQHYAALISSQPLLGWSGWRRLTNNHGQLEQPMPAGQASAVPSLPTIETFG